MQDLLAFLRGRDMSNAFDILVFRDCVLEAQNAALSVFKLHCI